jgi:hypothetical protein
MTTTTKTHKATAKPVDDPEFVAAYGGAYQASCGCGWTGEVRSRQVRAQAEADGHVAAEKEDS